MPVYAVPRSNLNSSIDPDSTCDETMAYSYGSKWVNVEKKLTFRCTDPTEGAAIWIVSASDKHNKNPYSESELESSTTKTSWKNKTSLELQPGEYVLKWQAEIMTSNLSASVKIKVYDESTICLDCSDPIGKANKFCLISGFKKIALESTSTFYFDFCSSTNKKSVSVRRVRMWAKPVIS